MIFGKIHSMIKDIVNQKDIQELISRDHIFGFISEKFGNPPNWTRPSGFISLSKTILEQQVSLASANAHYLKLNNYLTEFTPSAILSLSDEEMRSCQISRQKSKYLRGLSTEILSQNINLEQLQTYDPAEVRRKLTAIKGIGDWTADIYLLISLQHKDIFPIADIALINAMKELTNAQTKEEILLEAEKWKPLRSLATYFLWHYYLSKRNRISVLT